MRVKDSSGNIIPGLERDQSNGLVVRDKVAYNRYITEKTRIEKINNLELQVQSLTEIVQKLLSDKK